MDIAGPFMLVPLLRKEINGGDSIHRPGAHTHAYGPSDDENIPDRKLVTLIAIVASDDSRHPVV